MKLSMYHMHAALLVACIFLLAVTNVLGLDIWWHLAVGRYLLSSFSFPLWDVFSFTGSVLPPLRRVGQTVGEAVHSDGRYSPRRPRLPRSDGVQA
mgnify:CR=1 FL=1